MKQTWNLRTMIKLVISTLSLLLFVQAAWAGDDKRPNIILMVADDHGREVFGAYGNKTVSTPNLDAMANQGLAFNHAYATSASCSASRSVLLSGLHNHANGQYGHVHSYHHFRSFDTVKSLPVSLSEAGYRTAQVGKYHIGPKSVYAFDQYLHAPYSYKNGERATIEMAKAAIPLIHEKTDKPFFLYLATNDPHRSGEENATGDNTFGNATDVKNEGVARLDFDPKDVEVPHYLPDIPETRRELAELYQSVKRVDDTLGELVKQLKKAGKYDNTVIIYLSDNGTAMPGAKTTMYDPGIRLPLVVKPSGQYKHAGQFTEAMVSWPDITPTILSFANIEFDADAYHGRSFTDVIKKPANTNNWDHVFGSHTFHEVTMYYPMRSIRTRNYKLIWNIAHGLQYPFASDLHIASTWEGTLARDLENFGARPVEKYLHRPEFELYDVSNDDLAHESINLFGDPAHAEVQAELMKRLKAFQQKTNDPWVYKWDYE